MPGVLCPLGRFPTRSLQRFEKVKNATVLPLQLAPKTCDDVVPAGGDPPGGWQILYKMFAWCPRFEPKMWWMEELHDGDSKAELRPHVQRRVARLSAERGRKFLRWAQLLWKPVVADCCSYCPKSLEQVAVASCRTQNGVCC
jgi:hypothetical protein